MDVIFPRDEELIDEYYDKDGNLIYFITCKSNNKYWYLCRPGKKKVKRVYGSDSLEELYNIANKLM